MKYLLDAGTLSAALMGRLPVARKLAETEPGDIALSVVSRMQVEIGLRTQPRARARYARLLRVMDQTLRLIEFGEAEARQAATLGAYLQANGVDIGPMELMLAAQAITHQHTLVVENTVPYQMVTGLNLENWLSKSPEAVPSPSRKSIQSSRS